MEQQHEPKSQLKQAQAGVGTGKQTPPSSVTPKTGVPFYGRAFVASNSASASKNPKMMMTLVGCGVFTLACAAFPFFYSKSHKPMNSREEVS